VDGITTGVERAVHTSAQLTFLLLLDDDGDAKTTALFGREEQHSHGHSQLDSIQPRVPRRRATTLTSARATARERETER
jgi:hypothetical protein